MHESRVETLKDGVILDFDRALQYKGEEKKNLTPWRGVEPRSRAARRMTGACTDPIYYQGYCTNIENLIYKEYTIHIYKSRGRGKVEETI